MQETQESLTYVAELSDLPNGNSRCFNINGCSIIVSRVYGEVWAFRNHCPHLGKSMEGGRQMEYEFVCPHHNACFDIRTGKPVSGPSVWPLTTFPCQVKDGKVFVNLEKPQGPVLDPRMQK